MTAVSRESRDCPLHSAMRRGRTELKHEPVLGGGSQGCWPPTEACSAVSKNKTTVSTLRKAIGSRWGYGRKERTKSALTDWEEKVTSILGERMRSFIYFKV